IASGSDDCSVSVWSTSTGERLAGPFVGHSLGVRFVAFSPGGEQVASCDWHNIHIWDSYSAELAIPPIAGTEYAFSLVWTPDGKEIVAGCGGNIRVFSVSTGAQLAQWSAHTKTIRSIAISRDGRYITSGSLDSTVKLWDAVSHRQIGPPLEHGGAVFSVAISSDVEYIASAGGDGVVRLWSL
ncbi:hypothetical protein HYDPIDRAFT_62459, partial [Hydnomerulius pinastri MD-312]